MVPFVSRMICRSVRITKCKSRSKVESGVFRCGTPEFFLLPNSSCSLFEDPQNEWQQVINQVEKFFTDKTFFKWYHISKFTFDPFITPHLIISYNFGQTCTTIFLLPRPSHPTIIHNFTWTLDELVQCTMYNFPCFQSLTSNYSSEGFVQITPQLVRFWIISTGPSVKRSRLLDIEKTAILYRIKMRVGQTEKIQFKVAHVSLHAYWNMIWDVQYFNFKGSELPSGPVLLDGPLQLDVRRQGERCQGK